ncbi:MAG: NAD(P)-dependent oxidoreductase [Acetobacteraceae bacterium]|nr:NAD(P)-dependent oxidoreductase [Acetobacteraceae bacterium]
MTQAPSLIVTIVAQGAMGAGVAKRLTQNGVEVRTSLAGRSRASAERAAAAGMRDVEDAELVAAQMVLSIVPPSEAIATVERFAAICRKTGARPLYADLNAVSPETAARVAEIAESAGMTFADGGIIGGPPREDGYNPAIYVSGAEAPRLSVLRERGGLDIRVIDGPVGAASALKMSYAGITKGLSALASTMMLAATRAGAAEALYAELSQSQPQLLAWFQRQVPTMYAKAYRWAGEMEEIADFVGRDRAESRIYDGAARLYEHLAGDYAGEKREIGMLEAFLKRGGKPHG